MRTVIVSTKALQGDLGRNSWADHPSCTSNADRNRRGPEDVSQTLAGSSKNSRLSVNSKNPTNTHRLAKHQKAMSRGQFVVLSAVEGRGGSSTQQRHALVPSGRTVLCKQRYATTTRTTLWIYQGESNTWNALTTSRYHCLVRRIHDLNPPISCRISVILGPNSGNSRVATWQARRPLALVYIYQNSSKTITAKTIACYRVETTTLVSILRHPPTPV